MSDDTTADLWDAASIAEKKLQWLCETRLYEIIEPGTMGKIYYSLMLGSQVDAYRALPGYEVTEVQLT